MIDNGITSAPGLKTLNLGVSLLVKRPCMYVTDRGGPIARVDTMCLPSKTAITGSSPHSDQCSPTLTSAPPLWPVRSCIPYPHKDRISLKTLKSNSFSPSSPKGYQEGLLYLRGDRFALGPEPHTAAWFGACLLLAKFWCKDKNCPKSWTYTGQKL